MSCSMAALPISPIKALFRFIKQHAGSASPRNGLQAASTQRLGILSAILAPVSPLADLIASLIEL